MFRHQRTPLKQALFVVHLTRNSFQWHPLYRQHGRWGGESLLQQRHSRYFTINVKPLLFVTGKTWLLRCSRCCCHILICSPLWKTQASINFTFMLCTHNKWVRGVVVYQQPVLLSNLYIKKKKRLVNSDMFRLRLNIWKFRFKSVIWSLISLNNLYKVKARHILQLQRGFWHFVLHLQMQRAHLLQ